VIIGRLIPAGTGFKTNRDLNVKSINDHEEIEENIDKRNEVNESIL